MTQLSKNKELLAALKALAESGALGAAERRARLLAYLLEEELAGRGDRISAYSIGVDVLGRPDDFDPNSDAIVRAEMGRLRKALEHYYGTDGRLDEIQILIPARSNRPIIKSKKREKKKGLSGRNLVFACVAAASVAFSVGVGLFAYFQETVPSEPAAFEGPRVAVLDFKVSGDDPVQESFGYGLRVDMVTELSRFDWLTVFVSDRTDPANLPKEVGYYISGDIRTDGEQLIATFSVLKPESGELLWSRRYDIDRHAGKLIQFQQKAASEIAVEIARPEGLIADLEKRRVLRDTTDNDLAYSCIFQLYEFWRTASPEDHADLRTCLYEALEIAPDYAEAHAAMSVVYVEEARGLGIAPSVENPLERAEFHSRKALDLNPNSTLAAQAAFEIMAVKGDLEEFRHIGGAAIKNAPNNPDLLADYGLMLSLRLGLAEEGREFTDRAIALNPDPPIWYYYPYAMEAYLQGDYQTTIELSAKIADVRPVLATAVLLGLEARSGNLDSAENYYRELVPNVGENLDAVLFIVAAATGFHEKYISRLAQDYGLFENLRLAN